MRREAALPSQSDIAALFDAIAAGDDQTVGRLLDVDRSLAATVHPEHGYPPLQWGAMHGYCLRTKRNAPVVERLLEDCPVDIFAAAYLDRPDDIRRLLADGATQLSRRDGFGQTPLHHAAEAGALGAAQALLAAGADPNARDSRGDTPAILAAHPGPWKPTAAGELLELLYAHGAEIDVHLAAATGDVARLTAILDSQPERLEARTASGATPLFEAAHNLQAGAVRLLLARGADANAVGPAGQTPLDTAELHAWDTGGPATVKLLVAAGARRGS